MDANRSPMLVNELADVYAWEIDFLGLQKGDAFKVIYERLEVNGDPAGVGKIISSWFCTKAISFMLCNMTRVKDQNILTKKGKASQNIFESSVKIFQDQLKI